MCRGLLCPAGQGQHIVPTKTCLSATPRRLKEHSVPVQSAGCGYTLGKCPDLGVFRLLTPLICLTKMPKLAQGL